MNYCTRFHKYVSLMLYKTEVKKQLTFIFNFIKSYVEKSLIIYAQNFYNLFKCLFLINFSLESNNKFFHININAF